jgi:hypothetical protein
MPLANDVAKLAALAQQPDTATPGASFFVTTPPVITSQGERHLRQQDSRCFVSLHGLDNVAVVLIFG